MLKRVMLVLLAVAACGATAKPTVSMEESCRKAQSIIVVEPATAAGTFRVIEILHDGGGLGLKRDADVAVDLKGLACDKGGRYVLFLERAGENKGLQAVPQMRTEDSKEARDRVRDALRAVGKVK